MSGRLKKYRIKGSAAHGWFAYAGQRYHGQYISDVQAAELLAMGCTLIEKVEPSRKAPPKDKK